MRVSEQKLLNYARRSVGFAAIKAILPDMVFREDRLIAVLYTGRDNISLHAARSYISTNSSPVFQRMRRHVQSSMYYTTAKDTGFGVVVGSQVLGCNSFY